MSLYFVVSSVFMVVYLAIQTVSDIKTRKVYANLNLFAMAFMLILCGIKCVNAGVAPDTIGLFGSVCFLEMHRIFLKKVIGAGDAKALVAMYYQSALVMENSFSFDLFYPAFVYFIASVFFSVYVIVDGVRKKKKARDVFFGKERHAFFPCLFPAYLIQLIVNS